jgi:hypothetical protein
MGLAVHPCHEGAVAAPSMALFSPCGRFRCGGSVHAHLGMAILSRSFLRESEKAWGSRCGGLHGHRRPFLGGWLVHQLGWRGIVLSNRRWAFLPSFSFPFHTGRVGGDAKPEDRVRGGFIYGSLWWPMLGTSRSSVLIRDPLTLTGAVFLVLSSAYACRRRSPLRRAPSIERVFAFLQPRRTGEHAALLVAFLLALSQYINGMSSARRG